MNARAVASARAACYAISMRDAKRDAKQIQIDHVMQTTDAISKRGYTWIVSLDRETAIDKLEVIAPADPSAPISVRIAESALIPFDDPTGSTNAPREVAYGPALLFNGERTFGGPENRHPILCARSDLIFIEAPLGSTLRLHVRQVLALFVALLALGLTACDSCLPESFRATPKAAFERMAAARHQSCVQNNPCTFVSQCHAESEAYCIDAGYSKTCGNAELEGSCGINVK